MTMTYTERARVVNMNKLTVSRTSVDNKLRERERVAFFGKTNSVPTNNLYLCFGVLLIYSYLYNLINLIHEKNKW